MANGYNPGGRAGESYKGGYHMPQEVEFSSGGGRKITIESADPGVAEGLSTTAAEGPFSGGPNFVSKND